MATSCSYMLNLQFQRIFFIVKIFLKELQTFIKLEVPYSSDQKPHRRVFKYHCLTIIHLLQIQWKLIMTILGTNKFTLIQTEYNRNGILCILCSLKEESALDNERILSFPYPFPQPSGPTRMKGCLFSGSSQGLKKSRQRWTSGVLITGRELASLKSDADKLLRILERRQGLNAFSCSFTYRIHMFVFAVVLFSRVSSHKNVPLQYGYL